MRNLQPQKAVTFEVEVVYRPDVTAAFCFPEVWGSAILSIFAFDLLDSSLYERNKEQPEAEFTMTLQNYLPVDKAECLTVTKALQFSESLVTLY
jgi:hypothetical protein